MAIAFISVGASASGTTSIAVPHPASIAAGNALFLFVGNKYPTNGPTTPSGWTLLGQYSGGTVTAGIDSGQVYVTTYYKIATGSETGTVTVSIPSGNVAMGIMLQFSKAADKTWGFAIAGGADSSAGTSFSVTGDTNPGIAGGDVVSFFAGFNTDSYTYSSVSLTATGATIDAVVMNTNAQQETTPTGQDMAYMVGFLNCTAGTASAAPVLTMTGTGSDANGPAGAAAVVRLREVSGGSSMTAESGSYTLTGTAATLTKAVLLAAAASSMSLSGQAANLTVSRVLPVESATYSVSGTDASLNTNRTLTAEATTYTLTGSDAALTASGANVLTAESAAYTLTGQSAALSVQRIIAADAGSYSIGGQAALNVNRALTATATTYTLTGSDASLVTAKIITAAAASYTFTGTAVTLVSSAAAANEPSLVLTSVISTTLSLTSTIETSINHSSTIQTQLSLDGSF